MSMLKTTDSLIQSTDLSSLTFESKSQVENPYTLLLLEILHEERHSSHLRVTLFPSHCVYLRIGQMISGSSDYNGLYIVETRSKESSFAICN